MSFVSSVAFDGFFGFGTLAVLWAWTTYRGYRALHVGDCEPWGFRWLVGDDWMRWDSNGDGVSDGAFLLPLNGPNGEPLPPGKGKGILRGDFGLSLTIAGGIPISQLIAARLPITAFIGFYAVVIAVAISLTMGTIAAKPSVVELSMLAGFGVMGFLMRRFDYPVAPVVVGLILGPVAESQLRRALQISLGDPMVLLQSPMSATRVRRVSMSWR